MRFTITRLAAASASAAALLLSNASMAQGNEFLEMAKKKVATATMVKDKWDGPTAGPKAVAGKTIVFVAADMKNGGIVGVSKGVEEAGKAIGWTVRVIDGQGSVSGRTAALNQALALKPAGIVVGGFDTTEQKAAFEGATKAGVPLVGWHSGEQPGPNEKAGLFANVTTTADDVSEAAALWAVADSGGKAGVVIFTDSQYAIAVYKAKAMEAVIKKCGGCTVLSYEDSPISESSTRMPTLTTSLLQKLRRQVDPLAGDQRPVLRLHGPDAAGRRQEGRRQRRRLSPPATARRPPTSASATSATRPAPCPSR